jgi:serine/threonine protein kinase
MTIIGEWHVEEELASGDFGTVSRVSNGSTVGAMKLATGAHGPSRARLIVECDALERLSHPRIPRVLHNGLNEDPPHFVMELVPGTTVSRRVETWDKRGRVHGAKETASIIKSLLEILLHVYEAGLVHRDIKDANIMLDGDSAYLIDFGFCKPSGNSDMRTGDSFWRAGAARFSPLSKLDDPTMAVPSHDLYAAGVLAYRLLTGGFPWPCRGRTAWVLSKI